jgi:hypothetical protein
MGFPIDDQSVVDTGVGVVSEQNFRRPNLTVGGGITRFPDGKSSAIFPGFRDGNMFGVFVAIPGITVPDISGGGATGPTFVTIPNWGQEEVMRIGGGTGDPTPSASALGLQITEIQVQDPVHDTGDIIKMVPPAGTSVPQGSTVIVTVVRNPGE